jgi:GNAT superfamily N-acetyltransferase
MKIILTQTKNFDDYQKVYVEMPEGFAPDGAKFQEAIRIWCQIQDHNQKPDFWRVYLAKNKHGKTLGITGLYRTPSGKLWIGWFGLRPKHQKRGLGKLLLAATEQKAQQFGYTELFVYADNAIGFYEKQGYEKLGPCHTPGDHHQPGDIVLRKKFHASATSDYRTHQHIDKCSLLTHT